MFKAGSSQRFIGTYNFYLHKVSLQIRLKFRIVKEIGSLFGWIILMSLKFKQTHVECASVLKTDTQCITQKKSFIFWRRFWGFLTLFFPVAFPAWYFSQNNSTVYSVVAC